MSSQTNRKSDMRSPKRANAGRVKAHRGADRALGLKSPQPSQNRSASQMPIQATSMFDSAQEIVEIIQDEVFRYVNKRASEIGDFPIEDLIGKHIRRAIHPSDYLKVLRNYRKKLKGEPVDKYRYRGVNKKGETIWLEIMGTRILWEGRPAVLNFVTDVTEQVKAEEALKKSERMLSDIINFLPDPTFAIDAQGRIISWNREMEKMVGKKAEEMLGKDHYEYALPFYGKRIPMVIDLIRKPDKAREKQYRYFKREGNFLYAEHGFNLNGVERSLWCKASLMYDHKDQVIGSIETLRDITEFRNAASQLRDKSLHLEEANTALKVLLQHRQNDRREIEDNIRGNFKALVTPYLKKLRGTRLGVEQKMYLDILDNHLEELLSPFLMNMTAQYASLTPREIQIADLVKDGKSAKEIAEILNIALHTANNYRKRLRKKFALHRKSSNLRSHLLSFK